MEYKVNVICDLRWMEDLFIGNDKNDVDKVIDGHKKIQGILGNDLHIAHLIRRLKRELHSTILSLDASDAKATKKFYDTAIDYIDRINSLMYYTVYADDPTFIEISNLQYSHEYTLEGMLNQMPDPDMKVKLWETFVYPNGSVNIDEVWDECGGYINKIYDIQQDEIYDMLYYLRYKGIEYNSVDTWIDNLQNAQNKLNMFIPLFSTLQHVMNDIKDQQEKKAAEAEAKKAAKKKTSTKKADPEKDPELN